MKVRVYESKRGDLLNLDGKLVEYVKTPNMGGELDPKYLVVHYTAGQSMDGSINWLSNPKANASAHLVVDTDGTIVQMVPFDRVAWHVGKSKWDGIRGLNAHSIGIEVVNPGKLDVVSDGVYRAWWGEEFTHSTHPEIIHKSHPDGGDEYGWIPFTPEQVRVLIDVGSELMSHYGMREAVGHDMISPGRKMDPGPCMQPNVYDFLNGRLDDDVFMMVTGVGDEGLSIRKSPDVNSEQHHFSPLPAGTLVTREKVQGEWHLVRFTVEPWHEGWCHSNWLRRVQNEESEDGYESGDSDTKTGGQSDTTAGGGSSDRGEQTGNHGSDQGDDREDLSRAGGNHRPVPLSVWRPVRS